MATTPIACWPRSIKNIQCCPLGRRYRFGPPSTILRHELLAPYHLSTTGRSDSLLSFSSGRERRRLFPSLAAASRTHAASTSRLPGQHPFFSLSIHSPLLDKYNRTLVTRFMLLITDAKETVYNKKI